MYKALLHKLTSSKGKLVSIVSVAIYIATILIWQYASHHLAENMQTLDQVDAKTKKLASNVEVGMHINGFPSISFAKNNFTLDATIWFKYQKATESLNIIDQFTIKNSKVISNSVMYKSAPIVRIVGDDVVVAYHIQVTFMSYLKFKNFPLGDHKLNIILQNKSVTSREMCFYSSDANLTIAKDILVDDWKAIKGHAKGGYVKSMLKRNDPSMQIDYPCVVFAIDFASIGARNLFTLYFPLFVVFFLGLISLTIDLFNFSRLGIIASSLPMLVLFRMVIEGSSPQVGYATHIDFTFYTLVLLSLLILFLQMYIVLEAPKIKELPDGQNKQMKINKLEKINNYAFFGILILLVVFMTYNFLR